MTKNLLHKYVTIATLKRLLEGTIRITQPSAFNDPFELLPEIVVRKGHPEGPVPLSFDIRAPRREIQAAVSGPLPDDSRLAILYRDKFAMISTSMSAFFACPSRRTRS
jgi:hypothetical protein